MIPVRRLPNFRRWIKIHPGISPPWGRTVQPPRHNPTVAPYGLAATRAMESLSLDTATFKPVLVANVGQVATVFVTGNASIAFVSEAQVDKIDPPHVLSLVGSYSSVRQDAALLSRAEGNPAAQEFWAFLFADNARAIISDNAYDLP